MKRHTRPTPSNGLGPKQHNHHRLYGAALSQHTSIIRPNRVMMLAKSSAVAIRTAVGGATWLHNAPRALLSSQSTGMITHHHHHDQQTTVEFSASNPQQQRRTGTVAISGAASTHGFNTRCTLIRGGEGINDVSPSLTSVPPRRSSTSALVYDEAFSSDGNGGIKTRTAAQEAARVNVAMKNKGILTERAGGPSLASGTLGLERGDLRLGDFMEEVKNELWQYNAMPFRRRFRVQSLLR